MNEKLKILLIDDDPFGKSSSKNTKAVSLSLGIEEEQLNDFEDTDYGFPILTDPIGDKYEGFSNFFELKWLFSTSAIRDYINKMDYVEDMCGHEQINLNGYIPDIVVFDYALTGHQKNQTEVDYGLPIVKEKLNPCHKLDKFISAYKLSIPKPKKTKSAEDEFGNYQFNGGYNEDGFGLYAGGLIVEKYRRDTPCFGVPSTIWTSTMLENTEAGFFEWLLEQSLQDALQKEVDTDRGKDWGIIIDIAMPHYRNSILDLIKLNKIQVNLNELLVLLNGDFLPGKNGERKFLFFLIHKFKRTGIVCHFFIATGF